MAGVERRQSRGHKFARYADDFIVLVIIGNQHLFASERRIVILACDLRITKKPPGEFPGGFLGN